MQIFNKKPLLCTPLINITFNSWFLSSDIKNELPIRINSFQFNASYYYIPFLYLGLLKSCVIVPWTLNACVSLFILFLSGRSFSKLLNVRYLSKKFWIAFFMKHPCTPKHCFSVFSLLISFRKPVSKFCSYIWVNVGHSHITCISMCIYPDSTLNFFSQPKALRFTTSIEA